MVKDRHEEESVKILLVDDKPKNLYALEELLAADNRTILKAGSGRLALKMALQEDVALILLDVQMPEMSGFEVAELLKGNNRTRNIPIIFVTAINKEEKYVKRGYESGAVDYLFKPIDPEITAAKVSAFIKIFRQQKVLEEQNRRMEKLSMLVQNSADIMCILNSDDLTIEEVNPCWKNYLGYSTEEVKGTNFLIYLVQEKAPEIRDLLNPASADNKITLNYDAEMVGKDGSHKCINWNSRYKDGQWYSNGRDVAEQREVQKHREELVEHLQRANAQLDRYAHTIAHDLKTPLRGINSLTHWLAHDYRDKFDEEGQAKLDLIISRTTYLYKLLDDILLYSTLDKANLEDAELQDLNDIIQEEIKAMKIPGHIEVKLENKLPSINMLQKHVRLIFHHLIANSVKFMDKRKGIIRIAYRITENQPAISITDNGTGIEQKYFTKIFALFQTLSNDNEDISTGVGLPVVKKVLELYGADIRVDSKVGEFTTFTLSFPKERVEDQ
ncbi:MAG: response regulator [Bacteroidia bacterium]